MSHLPSPGCRQCEGDESSLWQQLHPALIAGEPLQERAAQGKERLAQNELHKGRERKVSPE